MNVVIGSDHAGFALKQPLMAHLRQRGHDVLTGVAERGIMVCGTGVGASIAANKVRGIRAAVLHDWHCAHQAVEHDDVNVMCIGAQIVGAWLAMDLVDAYLAAKFSDDPDFRRRVAKLHAMEAS
jgi:ribose 5-phosphate isomerase B